MAQQSSRKSSRCMLGLSFLSPAVATVIAMTSPELRVFLVNDDTTKSTVRGWVKMKLTGSKKEKTFIVAGIKNLQKLGPYPQHIHVAICDAPDLLNCFPKSIRIGDARHNDGKWDMATLSKEDLTKRMKWSEYVVPVHPAKVTKARASFITALPSPSKKFDPVEAMTRLFDGVNESFKENFETGVYEFLAGLINRRSFATIRRRAYNRVRGRDSKDTYGPKRVQDFKVLFSTVQRWIEGEGEGRAVSDAYQMCAKAKKVNAPVAAARSDANLEVLIRLIRHVPPSRRQEFDGYKWNPRKQS